jgi:hypothetical protein
MTTKRREREGMQTKLTRAQLRRLRKIMSQAIADDRPRKESAQPARPPKRRRTSAA